MGPYRKSRLDRVDELLRRGRGAGAEPILTARTEDRSVRARTSRSQRISASIVGTVDTLGLKSGMSIADIGAGTGYFSMRLAKVSPGLAVYAADIEPAMVDHPQKRAASEHLSNVIPVLAGTASPNLPKPVDVVLIVDTYHHVADRVAYFRALTKSLTPSGRVAIVDFRKDSPEGPPVKFRFTAEQIESEMTQAGYRLDGKHEFLPRQHFLIFH